MKIDLSINDLEILDILLYNEIESSSFLYNEIESNKNDLEDLKGDEKDYWIKQIEEQKTLKQKLRIESNFILQKIDDSIDNEMDFQKEKERGIEI